jgi:hypothetical protein
MCVHLALSRFVHLKYRRCSRVAPPGRAAGGHRGPTAEGTLARAPGDNLLSASGVNHADTSEGLSKALLESIEYG